MFFKKILYQLNKIFFNKILFFLSKLNLDDIRDFELNNYGSNYKLTHNDRKIIIGRIFNIMSNVESATSMNVHLTLVKFLLDTPKGQGFVVECGSFKGASACTLSIICKIIGKKLIIYDSFEGLPSAEKKIKRYYPFLSLRGYYKKGMYAGSLNDVKKNISKYGELGVVEFRKGLFETTLKSHKEKLDFVFIDVDLTSSTYTCIKYLWPKLKKGCYFFTDDACDMTVVECWFNKNWWKENLNLNPPGYVGSGCGIVRSSKFSSLGFAKKEDPKSLNSSVSWLHKQ